MIEVPTRIEPCTFDGGIPPVLADLAVELQREAGELGRELHPDTAAELADLVRVMNAYYSNLIEGHNTRPRDIELALAGAELDPARRPLALEARAHVIIQRSLDAMHVEGRLGSPVAGDFIRDLHRAFYSNMPGEFCFVERPDGSRAEIVPGEYRQTAADDVVVGRHQPPSSERLGAFMEHFTRRYEAAARSPSGRILAIAAAHHRFNFIHPFIDGNGRVSRLMSHAMFLQAGLGASGLWSISRGLARGLSDRGEYKRMMDHADSPRRSELDGRGNLSLAALREFVEWFLSVALDQLRFSRTLFAFETFEDRYRRLVRDVTGDRRAVDLLAAVLRHGMLERGDASIVLKTSERTARSTLSDLVRLGFLTSKGPKTAVRIAIPLDYRERLFPNLFAEAEVSPAG